MDQCPNCRARNPGSPQCRRCGMDLSRLLAVEAAAEQCIREALERLAAGDEAASLALLNQAAALHHDPMVERLRDLIRRASKTGGPVAMCNKSLGKTRK